MTMYADPTHIRNKRVNLSLTDAERRAVEAVAELNGTQPSVFIRELLLEFLASQSHASNSGNHRHQLRSAH